ncbi:hypothetical protein GPALN_012499 [Globodera pallida]|nr:hypothetical protein GPALN_012499 [Globodera pallida]
METPAGIDEVYKPHECRIHEAVFDTLSKPIHSTNYKRTHRGNSSPSPLKGRNQQQNGHRIHITWNHFGQKAKFHLDPNDPDLFEALHRSVRGELPNFRGNLAFKDYDKREVLIRCDRQIREAAASRGGNRLHIYTTLSATPSHHLAASELGTLSGSRPSSRVPPLRRPTTADSSAPLLKASEGRRGRQRVDEEENFLQRAREAVRGRSDDEEERRQQSSTVESGTTQTLSLAYPFWPVGALPIFFRGCWIGPNKFVYGGGCWGGWGPIPSRKNWHSVVGGGRPPW